MRVTVRNRLGERVEVDTHTATEAKSVLGEVLDRATARGKPRTVVLPMEKCQALAPRIDDPIEVLRDEFEAIVERMQTADAAAAGRALFEAPPRELGRAARSAARARR